MSPGLSSNVLWEVQPSPESDAAFHYGADISLLSQFAEEAEVLFPPCTYCVVGIYFSNREINGSLSFDLTRRQCWIYMLNLTTTISTSNLLNSI